MWRENKVELSVFNRRASDLQQLLIKAECDHKQNLTADQYAQQVSYDVSRTVRL